MEWVGGFWGISQNSLKTGSRWVRMHKKVSLNVFLVIFRPLGRPRALGVVSSPYGYQRCKYTIYDQDILEVYIRISKVYNLRRKFLDKNKVKTTQKIILRTLISSVFNQN